MMNEVRMTSPQLKFLVAFILAFSFLLLANQVSLAQSKEQIESRKLARDAALKALAKAYEATGDDNWLMESTSNRVRTYLNLGEDEKAFDIVKRNINNPPTIDQCVNRVLRVAIKRPDVDLLHRLLDLYPSDHPDHLKVAKKIFSNGIELQNLDLIEQIINDSDEQIVRDQYRLTLRSYLDNWAQEESSNQENGDEILDRAWSIVLQMEDVPALCYTKCYLINELTLLVDPDRLNSFLPSEEQFDTAVEAITSKRDPLRRSTEEVPEVYAGYRNVDRMRGRWNSARIAVAISQYNEDPTPERLAEIEMLLVEKSKSPDWSYDERIVRWLLRSGVRQLAIATGCKLPSINVSIFRRSNRRKNPDTNPFRLVTRKSDGYDVFDEHPLSEVLDQMLQDSHFDQAFDLANKMSGPVWQGLALTRILNTHEIDQWSGFEQPRENVHSFVLVQVDPQRGSVDRYIRRAEEVLLRKEVASGNIDSALNRLSEFSSHTYTYNDLVPSVAHALFMHDQKQQAMDLLRSIDEEHRSDVAYKTLKELCYDDEVDLAEELLDEFIYSTDTVDEPSAFDNALSRATSNSRGAIHLIAMANIRVGAEESVISMLRLWPDNERKALTNTLFSLADAATHVKNDDLLESLADFAIEAKLDNYLGPMLLAELHKYQEALELCDTVPGERAMNYQMLLKNMIKYRAPNRFVADTILQIDNPNRQKWALEDGARSLGYQNQPEAVMELGEMLSDLPPEHRALYWSGVAMGLSWHGRQR